MAITATMVRELRERTGAAMMDCKKALEAASGDIDGAIDHLRKQGLKSAGKKAERDTAEGRVFAAIAADGRRGTLVGVACETDFLAKGDGFKSFVDALEKHVLENDPDGLEDGTRPLMSQKWQGSSKPVSEAIQETVGQFGENIRVTSLTRVENPKGAVSAYVHHDGKQGAIASVTTGADPAQAGELVKSLCQHIVVFRPSFANVEEVPAAEVEREKEVLRESDEVKKKPAEFQDKIIEGKLKKFYAGIVLAEQPWIHDDKSTVAKALEKELGSGTRIVSFTRATIGG